MNEALLQRLADESDLRDLIDRYAFGLDTKDWVLWRSVFADSVVMDMSDCQPEPPPRPAPAELIVENAAVLFAGLERSQHFIGSHRCDIDGDRATITAHMRAEHWLHTGQGGPPWPPSAVLATGDRRHRRGEYSSFDRTAAVLDCGAVGDCAMCADRDV